MELAVGKQPGGYTSVIVLLVLFSLFVLELRRDHYTFSLLLYRNMI